MGYYINPKIGEKESFLEEFGKEIELTTALAYPVDTLRDQALVVLVDNGKFSAAGIAVDGHTKDTYLSPNDLRPKRFFLVPVSVLDSDAGLEEGFPVKFKHGQV